LWLFVALSKLIFADPPIVFVEDTFAKNSCKIQNLEKVNGSEDYQIGDLVQVGSDPVFFGEIQIFLEWMEVVLVGVQLEEAQIHVRTFGSTLLFLFV